MGDGNSTLWGSWVIKTPLQSFYFSGDSGYFAGFKEIGDKYGPFDITMVETGAYDNDWADIHMTPEESVQAHIDLKGKIMMPIHNGTFDLAFHTWHDPFDRVVAESERREVVLSTPEFGQIFSITDPAITSHWWKAE
jgi:L-ascorbate metabolism protein UlaG (beta-lactamase superfamily)